MFDVSICKVNLQIFKKGVFMKTIIFLIILIQSITYSQMEYKTHYNVGNNILRPLKIDESTAILYGSNGGILRTTDEGNSWEQNFTGTHSFIYKTINLDGYIYGVASNSKFMSSKDKGDYWEYKTLDFNCQYISNLEKDLIIADNSNKIQISNNYGDSWSNIKCPIDSILFMECYLTSIYIVDRDYNMYFSTDYGENWNHLELPIEFVEGFILKKINGELFVNNISIIGKISPNNTFQIYNLGKSIITNYDFVKNEFIIVNSSFINKSVDIYSYSIKDSKLSLKIQNDSLNINNDYFYNYGLLTFKDKYLINNNNKTILKFIKNIELLNYIPNVSKDDIIYNNNKTFYLHDKYGNISTSEDNGKFTKRNNYFIKQKNDDESIVYLRFAGHHFFNDSLGIFIVSNGLYHTIEDGVYTDDNGVTFKPIPDYFLKDSKIVKKSKDFVIIENESIDSSTKNSIYEYYKLDKDLKLQKISTYKNGYGHSKYIELENKTFCFFPIKATNDSIYFEIYETIDEFKSFTKLNTISYFKKLSVTNLAILDNKQIIIGLSKIGQKDMDYFIFNIESNELTEIVGNDTLFESLYNLNSTEDTTYLTKKVYTQCSSTITGQFQAIFDCRYVNINYKDNEFLVDTLGKAIYEGNEYRKVYKDIHYIGNYLNQWIPIEPERLDYYATSVEKPPSIWTYAPYPNPVKDKLKMKFYINNSADLSKLKLELINISSGKIYHLTDYKLSLLDDSMGEVEVNTKGYISGAYLINFKLGDANKSESIIIE